MLSLLDYTESLGVKDLRERSYYEEYPAPRGSFVTFGSIDSPQTPVALSTEVSGPMDGNSYVSLNVVVPSPIDFYGVTDTEFSITPFKFTENKKGELSVQHKRTSDARFGDLAVLFQRFKSISGESMVWIVYAIHIATAISVAAKQKVIRMPLAIAAGSA
jgi:hypothetical protein